MGALLKQQVRFLAIKEGLRLVDEQDLHSMVILLERYLGIERNILWREYQYHGGAWPFREVDQTWEKEAQARLEVEKRLEHVEDQFRQMQGPFTGRAGGARGAGGRDSGASAARALRRRVPDGCESSRQTTQTV